MLLNSASSTAQQSRYFNIEEYRKLGHYYSYGRVSVSLHSHAEPGAYAATVMLYGYLRSHKANEVFQ